MDDGNIIIIRMIIIYIIIFETIAFAIFFIITLFQKRFDAKTILINTTLFFIPLVLFYTFFINGTYFRHKPFNAELEKLQIIFSQDLHFDTSFIEYDALIQNGVKNEDVLLNYPYKMQTLSDNTEINRYVNEYQFNKAIIQVYISQFEKVLAVNVRNRSEMKELLHKDKNAIWFLKSKKGELNDLKYFVSPIQQTRSSDHGYSLTGIYESIMYIQSGKYSILIEQTATTKDMYYFDEVCDDIISKIGT